MTWVVAAAAAAVVVVPDLPDFPVASSPSPGRRGEGWRVEITGFGFKTHHFQTGALTSHDRFFTAWLGRGAS